LGGLREAPALKVAAVRGKIAGQINMRKVDRWQTLATKPSIQPIDLAA